MTVNRSLPKLARITLPLVLLAASASPVRARKLEAGGSWMVTLTGGTASARHGRSGKIVVIFKDDKQPKASKTHQLLSVVGSVVSFRLDWYAEGGAHPSYGTRFKTLDLSTGRPARLDRLFGERAVRRALLSDRVIKRALRGQSKRGSLQQLLERATGGCKMAIGPDALSEFAFHSLRGDKVAVRIGLSHGCEVDRGTFTQLGLLLTPPRALKLALRRANAQRALMAQLVAKKKK